MSILCEHGIVLWLLSILTWVIIWNVMYRRSTKGSFFFRYEYPMLFGFMGLSFAVLIILSEHLCW